MIALVLAACIGFGVAIRPAIHHDNNQPIQVARKAKR